MSESRRDIELSFDKQNANKGTIRGKQMVESSLQEVGAGRSIVVDKFGNVIAGNKTLEAWQNLGGEIEIVPTSGDKLIVIQRDDLDLNDSTGKARKLAYYDNRTSEIGLQWDTEQILKDLENNVKLDTLWHNYELDNLLGEINENQDQNKEWGNGLPEYEQKEVFQTVANIIVHIANLEDLKKFAELVQQTITEKTKFIWFPKQENVELKAYKCEDENEDENEDINIDI